MDTLQYSEKHPPGKTPLESLHGDCEPNLQDIYLYVHVPFCLKRCLYCYCTLMFADENLFSCEQYSDRYVDALVTEISSFKGESRRCKGISFGGGTPSLLKVPQIERILDALLKCCGSYDEKAQISMEIFPGTKTRTELKALHDMGFNRASLGAQSFDDEELRFWGRPHNTRTFYRTYDDLTAAGFDNINIDLLFGVPTEKPLKWRKSVDSALELQPKHLTTYYWYPTQGNYFYNKIKQGLLKIPGREASIEQYQYAIDAAAGKGLKRYWDFNFSRGIEYQYAIERDTFRLFPIRAFGSGTWSQEGFKLTWGSSALQVYLREPLNRREQECTIEYYVMRVLMFPQGLVFKEFEHLFNKNWSLELMSKRLKKAYDTWVENGFIEINDDSIRFKDETVARSSIYLAELHTRCLYCLEEELPFPESG